MKESLRLLEELRSYLSSVNWPNVEIAVHLEKMCCSLCNEQLQDCTQRCYAEYTCTHYSVRRCMHVL